MKRIRAHIEGIKTAAIVFLTASAMVLAISTGLFDGLIRGGSLFSAIEDMLLPELDEEEAFSPAAWPTSAMVGLEDGACGYVLDTYTGEAAQGALRELYDLFSANLGEALGSSGQAQAVTADEWEVALSGTAIYFAYDVELPVQVLSGWLGTEPGGADGLILRLCLTVEDDGVDLWYMDRAGNAARCTTAVAPDGLREKMTFLTPNGAEYAFQNETYAAHADTDPYSILLADYSQIPMYLEYNANNAGAMWTVSGFSVYGHLDEILERFGISALYGSMGDGTAIVDEDARVSIDEDGTITCIYRGTLPRNQVADGSPDLAQAIEAGRELAGVLNLMCNEADVYLTSWTQDGNDFELTFGYYLAGVPVSTERPAARIVIADGYITEVTLLARVYYLAGATSDLLPELQAAAAATDTGVVMAYVPVSEPSGMFDEYTTELRADWLLADQLGEEAANG